MTRGETSGASCAAALADDAGGWHPVEQDDVEVVAVRLGRLNSDCFYPCSNERHSDCFYSRSNERHSVDMSRLKFRTRTMSDIEIVRSGLFFDFGRRISVCDAFTLSHNRT